MALMVFASTGGVRVCVCVCVCLRVRVVCVRVCAVQGTSSVTYIVYCWLLCCCTSWLSWCLQVQVVCVCVCGCVCKYGWCACVCVCEFAGTGGVCVRVCAVQCKAQVVSPTLFIAAFSAAAPHGSRGVCKYGWCACVCVFAGTGGVCVCACVCSARHK